MGPRAYLFWLHLTHRLLPLFCNSLWRWGMCWWGQGMLRSLLYRFCSVGKSECHCRMSCRSIIIIESTCREVAESVPARSFFLSMIVSIDLIRFVLKSYCTSSAESSPPVPAPDNNTIASVWQSDDDPSTIRASSFPLSLPIGFQGSCWCSNSEREKPSPHHGMCLVAWLVGTRAYRDKIRTVLITRTWSHWLRAATHHRRYADSDATVQGSRLHRIGNDLDDKMGLEMHQVALTCSLRLSIKTRRNEAILLAPILEGLSIHTRPF